MGENRMLDELGRMFDETSPKAADEADARIRRQFMERILERYAFDVSCFSDPDWATLDDLLTNPDFPEDDESWDEEKRLAKAERAFLVSVGLWGIAEEAENPERQAWAKQAGDRFREAWHAGLSDDELATVVEAGKMWLEHLGRGLDNV